MLPPDDVNPEVVESPTFVERNFPFWAIIVSLVVTLPLLTTKYLTLFDYPNHVARYGLLSQFQDSPVFRSYFQVNNRFIPNLGFDFLAVNLGKWMSVVIASQLILATSVFLSSLGYCFLARKIQVRAGWSCFVAPVFAWTFSLVFGFNNFILAYAFFPWALLAFESFLDTKKSGTLVLYCALCVLTFLCHAQVAFLAIIIAIAFGWSKTLSAKTILPALLPCLVLLPLLAISPSSGEFSHLEFGSIKHKVGQYVLAFMTGSPKTDYAFLILFIGATIYLFVTRQLSIPKRALPVLATCVFLSILIPSKLKIAANLDTRMVGIVAAIFFVFVKPKVSIRMNGSLLLVALLVMRCGAMARQMRTNATVAQDVVDDFRRIPDNAIVLNVMSDGSQVFNVNKWNPSALNLAYFGIWDRPVFVSGLYSYPNQQPLVYSPEGVKLDYLGMFDSPESLAPAKVQLDQHFKAIRERMALKPADFWQSHVAFAFIGLPERKDYGLPLDLPTFAKNDRYLIVEIPKP